MEPAKPLHAAGPSVGDASFDAFYFCNCCGKPYQRDAHWLGFFGGIADRIVSDVRPRRVLDVGCALGLLVEALRERGVDGFGLDISSYAIANVYEPIKAYCRHASITQELQESYDLIVAIEVVEHMHGQDADLAIKNMCAHTRDILFSSSPVDRKEPTHINVRPPEFWAEQFARYGFFRDVDFDASFITPWAARFRKLEEPIHRVVRNYEKRFWELTVERNDVRSYSMETQKRLAATDEDRDRLRTQVNDLETSARFARERFEAEHESLRVQVAEARTDARHVAAERDDMALRLAHARQTIAHMERSWFWRVRQYYVRLRRLFQLKAS